MTVFGFDFAEELPAEVDGVRVRYSGGTGRRDLEPGGRQGEGAAREGLGHRRPAARRAARGRVGGRGHPRRPYPEPPVARARRSSTASAPSIEALRSRRRRVFEVLDAVGDRIRRRRRSAACPSRKFPAARVEELARGGVHQGVVARVGPYPYSGLEEILAAPEPLVLVLDGVTDPRNLGAVLRAADGAGASGVVIPKDRAVGVTAAAVKASAGASEHVPRRAGDEPPAGRGPDEGGRYMGLRRRGRRDASHGARPLGTGGARARERGAGRQAARARGVRRGRLRPDARGGGLPERLGRCGGLALRGAEAARDERT